MLSLLPSPIQHHILENFPGDADDVVYLKSFLPSSGGCVNQGGRLETSKGVYFIKWNDAEKYPSMFEAEAKGLDLLRAVNAIHVPEVIYFSKTGSYQYLILGFIPNGRKGEAYWSELGEALARIHQVFDDKFGLDHQNYIGSLPQINTRRDKWIDFFIEQRLEMQLNLLHENADVTLIKKGFEKLFKKLPEMIPKERASLLHGDLWNGNIMENSGRPSLIDPAVYYGHREMDIAMTKLFGGFSPKFYEGYNNVYPLQPGHEERTDIFSLYPLLVHANLFGGSYLFRIREILKSFI